MSVARELGSSAQPRAVAIGTFDGVHRGHRRVLEAARAARLRSTVVTFDPHPRTVLGDQVELLTTTQRRLELFEAAGVEDVLRAPLRRSSSPRSRPRSSPSSVLRAIGAEVVAAGDGVPLRPRAQRRPRPARAARLRRPPRPARRERLVEPHPAPAPGGRRRACGAAARTAARGGGDVVARRPARRDARLPDREPRRPADLLVPPFGIYAGAALGHRAAISIGTNPHYGGMERRVEALPARLRGRPLRRAARRLAVAAAARRGGLRLGGRARRGHRGRRPHGPAAARPTRLTSPQVSPEWGIFAGMEAVQPGSPRSKFSTRCAVSNAARSTRSRRREARSRRTPAARVRLRRLDSGQRPGGAASWAPLRRGSAARPCRPIALTPPK